MDVTKMTFKPNEFDFIFDKGTLDCLSCAENSSFQIEKYLQNIRDFLKPKGVFLCISHGNQEQRMKHFQQFKELQVEIKQIEK